ncbi:peroxisomal enoyl-CoA-hydratase [Hymenopellis radicata]|nr:peroxisomal enoyl-CoA-hydratase [Hymenopellis radicata]
MASPALEFTSPFKNILVQVDGAVCVITLNRPEAKNAFTLSLARELVSVLELCDKEDRISVVILTAEPTAPAFCPGLDLSTLNPADATTNFAGLVALAVYRCRKITISAVNGHAAGAGVTALQLPFDFRFAWDGAKLALPFVRLGIAPEGLSSVLLPRLLGESRAKALLMSGIPVLANSPLVEGLYFRLFDKREDVFPAAFKFGKELARNTSQISAAYAKGLINYNGGTVEETNVLESKALLDLAWGADIAEVANAFKQKRAPNMTGTLGTHRTKFYPWWGGNKARL